MRDGSGRPEYRGLPILLAMEAMTTAWHPERRAGDVTPASAQTAPAARPAQRGKRRCLGAALHRRGAPARGGGRHSQEL
jgi:hypothetical protein